MAAKLSKAEVKDAIRRGAIVAIPKKGESSADAIARVQVKHPGREVIDPPIHIVQEIDNEVNAKEEGGAIGETAVVKEQLARVKGFGSILTNGVEILAKPTAYSTIPEEVDGWNSWSGTLTPASGKWERDHSRARFIYEDGVLDRKMSLFQLRSHKIIRTTEIGRDWTPNYAGNFSFRKCTKWGESTLKVEPAYSGAGAEIMDASAIKAIQALPHALNDARQDDFSTTARHSIHDLQRTPYNPVRLLTRFAALWMTAKLVEDQGGNIEITGGEAPPTVRVVNTGVDLSALLITGARDGSQVLYTEVERVQRDLSILQVYLAVLTGKLEYKITGAEGIELPTIAKFWPHIPKTYLAISGEYEVLLNYGFIRASSIWTAIELFVIQMKLQDLWNEVLLSVATYMMRPKQDTAFCGFKDISLSLPASGLSPAALGPLLTTMRHWEEHDYVMAQPLIADLCWEGCARYSMWSLLYRDLCSTLGGAECVTESMDVEYIKRTEFMLIGGGGPTPIARNINLLAQGHGWDNLLGRILETMRPVNVPKMRGSANRLFVGVPLLHKWSIQWDEVLDCTDRVPEGAAVLSELYPAKPTQIPPTSTWIRPTCVINRYGIADAVYSMCNIGISDVGILKTNLQNCSLSVTEYTPRLGYRGALLDSQFYTTKHSDGMTSTPVCWLPDTKHALQLYALGNFQAESQWFISTDFDLSDNGYMRHFRMLEEEFPSQWKGTMLEAWADYHEDESSAEEDEEEEEEGETEERETEGKGVRLIAKDVRHPKYVSKVMEPFDFRLQEYNMMAERIADLLGEQPTWVTILGDYVWPVKAAKVSVTQSVAQTQLLTKCFKEMEHDNPLTWPVRVEQKSNIPELMDLGADLVRWIRTIYSKPSPQMRQLLTLESGLRNIKACYSTTGGVYNARTFYEQIGVPPSFVKKDELTRLIHMGADPQAIIGLKDKKAYDAFLATMQTDVEERIQQAMRGRERLIAEGTEVQEEPEEQKFLETRPEGMEIEPVPTAAPVQNFGGAQPSPGYGEKDPVSETQSAATGATQTSPVVASVEFTAQKGPGEPSAS
jgi:hypothetical protein